MGLDKNRRLSATAELRRHAEEQLKAKTPETDIPLTNNETQRLLHELQVHQIELEMQNAELLQVRDEMETALEKYTELYDFAPVGYFTLGRDEIIHAVNLGGARLLGIERARLLGRSFGLFLTAEAGLLFTDFLGTVFASQCKASFEVALLTEGTGPLIVHIEALASGSGQECRFAIIDITERKRADAEIQRLASFPLMNPNPILELDANGQMTFCNPAAKQVLGNAGYNNDITPLIPQDISVILQDLRDKKTGQFIRNIEMNSCFFEERIYISPPFQSVRIYMMDITERKRAAEEIERLNTDLAAHAVELEAANIELEAFNYTVSHDLRNPLTVINSYCQVIQELYGNKLDDECKGYIQEMYKGTLRMSQLIDTFLDFSRVAHVEIRHDKVALSKMAEEIALGLKKSEPERRVTFRIAEGIIANSDAGLLRVVLNNLIGNAWKHSGKLEEVVIEFGVAQIDGKTVFFIRDNGPGFNMTHAKKLFVPFQRLSETDVVGHGIGLATVDRIVRRLGGKVWAESKSGEGATFLFTLE